LQTKNEKEEVFPTIQHMTTIEDLPEEVRVSVLSYLQPSDLALGVGLASRSYHRIAGDDSLWWSHLDLCHPKWRIVMSNLKVDIAATPARECLRRLTERHDPTEDRAGCCQHDLNRGALCLCCTCRCYHHHNPNRSNARSTCSRSFSGYCVAQTYGSSSATKEALAQRSKYPICDWDSILAWHNGILVTSETGRVEWTEWAHQNLRPPLELRWQHGDYTSVLYTDADLCAMNRDSHPEFFYASLEKTRDLLQALLGCGKRYIELDGEYMRLASCGWRTPEQTRVDLEMLSDAGWIVLRKDGLLGDHWSIHLTDATFMSLQNKNDHH
jgi:hypothetical protein